jgi:hypothetical protein
MDLDEIMSSYLNEVTEKEKKKIQTSQEDRLIAAKKRKILEPVRLFLQKFVDLEVTVNHRDQYTKNSNSFPEPQKFSFEEIDSSKSWSPGVSILINHPAEIEIAVPNHPTEEGLIIIRVATHHPDAYILEQKFNNVESACKALAKFLGKCTISIGKNPSILTKEQHFKKNTQNNNFLYNAPNEFPNNIGMKKINDLFNENE